MLRSLSVVGRGALKMKSMKVLTFLNLSIVYLVWGSTFLGSKLAIEGGFGPFALVGLRTLVAGAVLYGVARLSSAVVPSAKAWREAFISSSLLLVGGTGLVAWSQVYIPSSLSALLVATSPVWITMLDSEQKLTVQKWVGLLLGIIGVGSLVGASLDFSNEGVVWGIAGTLLSSLSWALGALRTKRNKALAPPVTQAGMQLMTGGMSLLTIALIGEGGVVLEQISALAWGAWLYVTVLGSIVGYSSYTWLVNNTSAAVASTHAYVNPVVAVILGSVIAGESLTMSMGIAAFVALTGVVILMLPEPTPRLVLVTASGGEPRDRPRGYRRFLRLKLSRRAC